LTDKDQKKRGTTPMYKNGLSIKKMTHSVLFYIFGVLWCLVLVEWKGCSKRSQRRLGVDQLSTYNIGGFKSWLN
jgi:hypothetical protein